MRIDRRRKRITDALQALEDERESLDEFAVQVQAYGSTVDRLAEVLEAAATPTENDDE